MKANVPQPLSTFDDSIMILHAFLLMRAFYFLMQLCLHTKPNHFRNHGTIRISFCMSKLIYNCTDSL